MMFCSTMTHEAVALFSSMESGWDQHSGGISPNSIFAAVRTERQFSTCPCTHVFVFVSGRDDDDSLIH